MRKTKSPVLENKENDFRVPTPPRNLTETQFRPSRQSVNKSHSKSPLALTPQKFKQHVLHFSKANLTPQKLNPVQSLFRTTNFEKNSELEKPKSSFFNLKRSSKKDKNEFNFRNNKKSMDGITSDRKSKEQLDLEKITITQKSNRKLHPNYQNFKEVFSQKTNSKAQLKSNAKIGLTDTTKPKIPPIDTSGLHSFDNSSAKKIENLKHVEENNSKFPILNEHLEIIEHKFSCMQKIFASQNQSLNLGQLSVFLSKLGWISELDKNLEIQKPEEEILVDTIFEGLNFEGKKDISFSILKKVLAIISALFSNKTIPKCFECKENQSRKMENHNSDCESLARKISQSENAIKPIENLSEQISPIIESNKVDAQSIELYYGRFHSVDKSTLLANPEPEMQFSFRKPEDGSIKKPILLDAFPLVEKYGSDPALPHDRSSQKMAANTFEIAQMRKEADNTHNQSCEKPDFYLKKTPEIETSDFKKDNYQSKTNPLYNKMLTEDPLNPQKKAQIEALKSEQSKLPEQVHTNQFQLNHENEFASSFGLESHLNRSNSNPQSNKNQSCFASTCRQKTEDNQKQEKTLNYQQSGDFTSYNKTSNQVDLSCLDLSVQKELNSRPKTHKRGLSNSYNSKQQTEFCVNIEIGDKNELIIIHEDDDISKIVDDFVKKHNIMDKYLIVYEAIQENYQKLFNEIEFEN